MPRNGSTGSTSRIVFAKPLSSKPRRKCTRDLMAIGLELREVEGRAGELRRLDDLRQVAADQHDVAVTEG